MKVHTKMVSARSTQHLPRGTFLAPRQDPLGRSPYTYHFVKGHSKLTRVLPYRVVPRLKGQLKRSSMGLFSNGSGKV